MEKLTKKIIFNVACGIALFGLGCGVTTGFIVGRAERNSGKLELTEYQLREQLSKVNSELDKRTKECEKLASDLEFARDKVDGLALTSRQLRLMADDAAISTGNISSIVAELRRRVFVYEERIRILDNDCQELDRRLKKQ